MISQTNDLSNSVFLRMFIHTWLSLFEAYIILYVCDPEHHKIRKKSNKHRKTDSKMQPYNRRKEFLQDNKTNRKFPKAFPVRSKSVIYVVRNIYVDSIFFIRKMLPQYLNTQVFSCSL